MSGSDTQSALLSEISERLEAGVAGALEVPLKRLLPGGESISPAAGLSSPG
jgi:hypothetical protein